MYQNVYSARCFTVRRVGPFIFCRQSNATEYACDWSGLPCERRSTLRKQMTPFVNGAFNGDQHYKLIMFVFLSVGLKVSS